MRTTACRCCSLLQFDGLQLGSALQFEGEVAEKVVTTAGGREEEEKERKVAVGFAGGRRWYGREERSCWEGREEGGAIGNGERGGSCCRLVAGVERDRKSTRLNSSHAQ